MNSITEWFNQFLSLFTTANLQLLLLVGSGILAITLLVLAMTRWGHSRPVWKCVILSFAAHILLIGYAYGTRLIFDTPVVVAEVADPMRVNLVEEEAESTEDEDQIDSSPNQSWDQFVNQQAMPRIDELERPAIDSEVVIEKTVDRAVEMPSPSDATLALDQLPQKFAEPEFMDPPDRSSSDFPIDKPPLDAQPIDVTRRGQNGAANQDFPTFDNPDTIPRQEVNHDFSPLANADPSSDIPSPTKLEPPFSGELVDVKSDVPFAPDSLPPPAAAPEFKNVRPLRSLGTKSPKRMAASPHRIGDGQPMPKIYSLRNAENRLEIARRRGGSMETEQAVELALKWLAENQEEDGSWDPQKSGAGQETKVFGHDRQGAALKPNPASRLWQPWHFWPAVNRTWKVNIKPKSAKGWNTSSANRK